jgi:hypothetical protein
MILNNSFVPGHSGTQRKYHSAEKYTKAHFIEERPYVDFITCVKMNQYIDRGGAGAKTLTNVEEVLASTARSILVSYHDGVTRHIITTPANCVC